MDEEHGAAQVEQLDLFCPAQLRRKALRLRERSRQCAALASDCLTDEGRQVLERMAVEFEGEAHELDNALLTIRRIYAERFGQDFIEQQEA